jgi:hypothetical protein
MLFVSYQLQTKLSRIQQLSQSDKVASDGRDTASDNNVDTDSDEESQLLQVGPTANMSLLDQHSKLKMEALGSCL